MGLKEDIQKVRDCLNGPWELVPEEDKQLVWDIELRFASFLPSPSKMNAMSVLKHRDNTTEKLTSWLEEREEYRHDMYTQIRDSQSTPNESEESIN